MNAPMSVGGASARAIASTFRTMARWLAGLGLISLALAQTAPTGKIAGRIFNPATQEYLRAAEVRVSGTDLVAYSGDDGSYVLTGVPPGEVGLTVTYTGDDPVTPTVNVTANG